MRIESIPLFLNVNTQWWEQQWWNKITINNSKENQKTPISVLAEAKTCTEDTYQATYNTKKKTTTILIETKMSNKIKLKPAHFSSGIKHSICHKLWTKRKKKSSKNITEIQDFHYSVAFKKHKTKQISISVLIEIKAFRIASWSQQRNTQFKYGQNKDICDKISRNENNKANKQNPFEF